MKNKLSTTATLVSVLIISIVVFIQKEFLLKQLDQEPSTTLFVAFFISSLIISLSLIPTGMIIKISSGYLLGFTAGSIISHFSIFLSSFISFYISKRFLSDFFRSKYKNQIDYLSDVSGTNTFLTVIRVRLVPILPFQLSNYVLGCMNISIKTFSIASFLGLIPATLFYNYIGSNLKSLQHNSLSAAETTTFYTLLLLMLFLTFIPKLRQKLS